MQNYNTVSLYHKLKLTRLAILAVQFVRARMVSLDAVMENLRKTHRNYLYVELCAMFGILFAF